ncbi:MAG: hypothetical protein H7258_14130 [Ferruginibacter sp.]|nr:hypothetical protein [Ferruginibacter sp.]
MNYLKDLSLEGFISVFGFVIMPNHLHLIWCQNKMNGKESPKSSFLKYTSHTFLKQLKLEGKAWQYRVNASNKKHEIWQRDSLGIEIYSRNVAQQKLDYIPVRTVSAGRAYQPGEWQMASCKG